jgi:hypothetical protein
MRRLLIVMVAGMTLLAPVALGELAGASVFPGTNGKIAFAVPGPDDNGTVFTINPDGTHEAQIGAGVSCQAWSPDGTKLLFQRIHRGGRVDLETVSTNGAGRSTVTDLPGLTPYAWGTAPLS